MEMRKHRLDPLLRPKSLVLVGASPRKPSVGATLVKHARSGGYKGRLYAINPRHREIEGIPCFPDFASLPEAVEHAVFALPDTAMEEAFAVAVTRGIKAATIISSIMPEDDGSPLLRERITKRAREAGVQLCGANCMGFYNFTEGLWTCGFETRDDLRPGGVVLLTHSGSLLTALVDAESRIDYALAVSTGQELTTTVADYMDYALDQPETRVIGLFIETVRDPAGFEAALAKAGKHRVPVIALKVGRTAVSAKLAISHSGALAGDDAAYQAVFDHYGVSRVESIDELASALMVFNAARDIGPGGLVTTHDSGGERGLLVDLAERNGTRLADLSPATVKRLEEVLDFGLPPVNPLDRWATGRNYPQDFYDSFETLMEDPDTALGAVVLDRGAGGLFVPDYFTCAERGRAASSKPTFIVSNHQGSGSDPAAIASTRAGIPVLDGVPAFLKACRLLFEWRDFNDRPAATIGRADSAVVERWRKRLASGAELDEAKSLSLLRDFGIQTVACVIAETKEDAIAQAASLGYPVALKTAMPGVAHKSDQGGVHLRLADAAALADAYRDLAKRLGPRVLVARMVQGPAVEMLLGLTNDPDFGPIVVAGFGGIHAEVLRDVAFLKPPFDAAIALRHIERLQLAKLLDGLRGAPAVDRKAFAEAAAALSRLAVALGEQIQSMDINPLLVLPDGCLAVDALIDPRAAGSKTHG
ncbi:MAG: acetate--CoA ligase family protein [Kiloniellales bacterium]